jgi:hypothetical protein
MFAVAALSYQMRDYASERLFVQLKEAGYGEPGAVAFYLAEVAEETRRYDVDRSAIASDRGARMGGQVAHSRGHGQAGQARRRAALSRLTLARRPR